MAKTQIVQEMMVQRGFDLIKQSTRGDQLVGVNKHDEYIFIKIYSDKFELNKVREFLWSKFVIINDVINLKNNSTALLNSVSERPERPKAQNDVKKVRHLIIVCKSFQNSHTKEFKDISKNIELIRSDFFNINITKKAPPHVKVDNKFIKIKKELPGIKDTDPNCVFYNFSKGDLIQVTRSDGDICYRVVR